jgi:N-acetylmuramoyl-L-alanine amidase
VHSNKASSTSARGTEAWYFTSFSQPLANSVSASVASYFTNYAYADHASKNRGAKYDYFAVTLQQEFPSILLELGFVSNYEEAMIMANATHQNGIADAVVQGCKNYLAR